MYNEVPRPKKTTSHKRGMRRRLKFFFLMMVGISVWAGMTWFDQHSEVLAKLDKLQQLEAKLEETKLANEKHKLEIERMNDPEYLEQLLRKELRMTKDGEKLFIKTN